MPSVQQQLSCKVSIKHHTIILQWDSRKQSWLKVQVC